MPILSTIPFQDRIIEAKSRLSFIEDYLVDSGSFTADRMVMSTSGSGASAGSTNVTEAGAFGIYQFSTGTSTTGQSNTILASVGAGTNGPFFLGQGIIKTTLRLKTGANLSDGTNTYRILFGLVKPWDSTTITDGAWFEYDSTSSANWRYRTASSSSSTSNSSSISVDANTWYRLRLEINAAASSVEYFIDDVSIGTINTNIPGSSGPSVQLKAGIHKSAGTTARNFLIDYIVFQYDFTTLRD